MEKRESLEQGGEATLLRPRGRCSDPGTDHPLKEATQRFFVAGGRAADVHTCTRYDFHRQTDQTVWSRTSAIRPSLPLLEPKLDRDTPQVQPYTVYKVLLVLCLCCNLSNRRLHPSSHSSQ